MKIKTNKTALAKNISLILPLVEEVTKDKLLPICLLGFAQIKGTKQVQTRFATLSDDHDQAVYMMCKAFVEQFKDKYEKK
jgi:hypothetical protein